MKGIEQLKDELIQISLNAPFVRSQEILGLQLGRIFNNGKSTDGSQIGTYDDTKKQTFLTNKAKPSFNKKQLKKLDKLEKAGEELTYKQLRQLRGLQVDFVDLQFTGALFENISSGKTSDGAVIGHTNLEEAKIASYLEKKYKKDIFPPSKTEIESAKEIMTRYVTEEIKKSIKSIFNG